MASAIIGLRLTFIAALQHQVAKEAISSSDAPVLRVRVVSEMIKLIGIGGGLARSDEPAEVVDERKLLAGKRGLKLLGSGAPAPPETEK